MKISRTLLLFGVLASFMLVTLASPISEKARDRFSRQEGDSHWLFPRKGGGGGGKGGAGGEGGGSSSSSSGAKPGSGSTGDGSTGSTSNTGGRTTTGSGTPRGSTGFYAGGATVPYRAGLVSPLGLSPFFIAPFVFWMPFYWGPYGAYYYRINHTAPAEANNTAHNTTDPILCVCENYQPCGCDNANGSYTPTDLMYAVINGTEYAVVNGTLENGTTAPGAASGGVGMGLYLTKSGAWASWMVFVLAGLLAVQAL